MRQLLAGLLVSASFVPPAAALGDMASFERIHSECVSVGEVSFGPRGRWADCRVDKGRWFSTIGHIDFYQTQYCLGKGGEDCEQRALLLFANRAYTPVARMVLGRLDPGDTRYDDPLVRQTPHGEILTLQSQRPGAPPEQRHYLWHQDRWQVIETAAVRRELTRRLPPGVTVRGALVPDFDNMRAEVELWRRTNGATGSAEIELGLVNTRLAVKSVQLALPSRK